MYTIRVKSIVPPAKCQVRSTWNNNKTTEIQSGWHSTAGTGGQVCHGRVVAERIVQPYCVPRVCHKCNMLERTRAAHIII